MGCNSLFSVAIRSKNQELLDAESGSEGEMEKTAPARKKARTSERLILSDDEAEMAAGLASIQAVASTRGRQVSDLEAEQEEGAEQNSDQDEANQRAASRGEDEEDPELLDDLEGIDVNEADVDMDLGSGGADLSNEVSDIVIFRSVSLQHV